jgi:hypothetical protein
VTHPTCHAPSSPPLDPEWKCGTNSSRRGRQAVRVECCSVTTELALVIWGDGFGVPVWVCLEPSHHIVVAWPLCGWSQSALRPMLCQHLGWTLCVRRPFAPSTSPFGRYICPNAHVVCTSSFDPLSRPFLEDSPPWGHLLRLSPSLRWVCLH